MCSQAHCALMVNTLVNGSRGLEVQPVPFDTYPPATEFFLVSVHSIMGWKKAIQLKALTAIKAQHSTLKN